jgi:predicted double-glycine peptidase
MDDPSRMPTEDLLVIASDTDDGSGRATVIAALVPRLGEINTAITNARWP